jgi:hypothetical protein
MGMGWLRAVKGNRYYKTVPVTLHRYPLTELNPNTFFE